MKVLMVDNYDSFTYNLVQYLGELGAEPVAVRNDAADVDELLAQGFDRVVVSPGPCTPNEAGMSVEVMRRFPEAGVPSLGVCLGHQSLVQAFGGKVVRHVPVHGKATEIPASLGVQGPGETTTRSQLPASRSSTSAASLRTASTSAPSSPRYWTRLYAKLS